MTDTRQKNVIHLVFNPILVALLAHPPESGEIHYHLTRRASIKDIIEALAVPHTEVGCLLANGAAIDFSYIPAAGDRIEILPLSPPVDVRVATPLRPHPLPTISFAVDANVAKLAPLLRMIGMDCWYQNDVEDATIAHIAHQQQRILLTRDHLLLKRKEVVFGHLLRSQDPHQQLRETVDLYGLRPLMDPFSRCMACNGQLREISKNQIRNRLEPLTKKYYDTFHLCSDCGKIYWPGSHRQRMEQKINALLAGPQS